MKNKFFTNFQSVSNKIFGLNNLTQQNSINRKKWKTQKYKYINTRKNTKKNKKQIGGFVYGKTKKTLSIRRSAKNNI